MFFSGDRLPGFSDTIEHPDGLVLVDTGMIDTTPAIEDDGEEWHPNPLTDELVSRVAVVVNTHLHFDHCGGNRLFPGIPIHVQRRELADARTKDDYTVREWVDFPGATYVEHDGEAEILPGVRLLPAPGHTAGHQIVVVEAEEGPVVLGGDVGHWFEELERGETPGQQLVLELAAPTYLAHVAEVRVPHRGRSVQSSESRAVSAASTLSWIDGTSRISVRTPDAESTRTRPALASVTLVASRRQRSAGSQMLL
jgi:N-acyl homoserine lactone hydrolase